MFLKSVKLQISSEETVNKRLKPTSTALLVLCFTATLAQNNQLRSGGLAGRYERGSKINKTSHVLDVWHAVERLAALK